MVALPLASVSTTLPVNESVAVAEPSAFVNVATPAVAVIVSMSSGSTVPTIEVPEAISDPDTTDAAEAEVASEVRSEAEATLETESSLEAEADPETGAAPEAEGWLLTVVPGTPEVESALALVIRSALPLIAALVGSWMDICDSGGG